MKYGLTLHFWFLVDSHEYIQGDTLQRPSQDSDGDQNLPSGSNGSKDAGPICAVYGAGSFCDGRNCVPCRQALGLDLVTPPSKRQAMDPDVMSGSKRAEGDRDQGSESADSWLLNLNCWLWDFMGQVYILNPWKGCPL